jgi:hypothetical protein
MGTPMNLHPQLQNLKFVFTGTKRSGQIFALGIVCIACLLMTIAATEAATVGVADPIVLKITMDDETAEFEMTAFDGDLSIADIMKKIAETEKEFRYKSRGRGDTFFVTEINGRKNEGARGRNWIFKVNGKLGNKSAGSFKIKAGDKVEWNFQKYQPTP